MLGIRREDKNEWERRVPLTPDHVGRLRAAEDLSIHVQTSPFRAFSADDYRAAGATVTGDLSACSIVVGVKEIPVEHLVRDQAYLFFSHTTKGQAHNMPMLRRLLELGCTLLDYEQIADHDGRRLIFFGRHAGYAGMIDTLWSLGRRLEIEGIATPFSEIRPAHEYDSLAHAREQIATIGDKIRAGGIPTELRPMIFGFAGTGNVSLGAQEILDLLPFVELGPGDLADGLPAAAAERNAVFKFVIDLDQRFKKKGGGPVTLEGLSNHPEQYVNATLQWLPHLTVLVNGMFWVKALPRLLTLDELRTMWRSGELARLKVIGDIACDIDGAIEATVKATTPADPVFVYDVDRGPVDGFEGNGPVVLAVDNLPAELPRESSQDFGDTLMPFVPALARCDWNRPFDVLELPPELERAIIAHRGALSPRFAHLERYLR